MCGDKNKKLQKTKLKVVIFVSKSTNHVLCFILFFLTPAPVFFCLFFLNDLELDWCRVVQRYLQNQTVSKTSVYQELQKLYKVALNHSKGRNSELPQPSLKLCS